MKTIERILLNNNQFKKQDKFLFTKLINQKNHHQSSSYESVYEDEQSIHHEIAGIASVESQPPSPEHVQPKFVESVAYNSICQEEVLTQFDKIRIQEALAQLKYKFAVLVAQKASQQNCSVHSIIQLMKVEMEQQMDEIIKQTIKSRSPKFSSSNPSSVQHIRKPNSRKELQSTFDGSKYETNSKNKKSFQGTFNNIHEFIIQDENDGSNKMKKTNKDEVQFTWGNKNSYEYSNSRSRSQASAYRQEDSENSNICYKINKNKAQPVSQFNIKQKEKSSSSRRIKQRIMKVNRL